MQFSFWWFCTFWCSNTSICTKRHSFSIRLVPIYSVPKFGIPAPEFKTITKIPISYPVRASFCSLIKLEFGESIMLIQMGTNECASQAGMNPYGMSRQIYDQREAKEVEKSGQVLGSRFPGSNLSSNWTTNNHLRAHFFTLTKCNTFADFRSITIVNFSINF